MITNKEIIENLIYKLILNNIINNKMNYSITSIIKGINFMIKFIKPNNNIINFMNQLININKNNKDNKIENEKDYILGIILFSLDGIYNNNENIINKYYYKIGNYIKNDEYIYNEKYIYLIKPITILKRLLNNFEYEITYGYNNYKMDEIIYNKLNNMKL